MSKRPLIASAISIAALALLLSFKTPAPITAPPAGSAGAISASYSGTLTGSTISTPYGPVQVQVTLAAGKITNVTTLQMPSSNQHSAAIAAYAAPQLRSEVLTAGSARVDTISGATYTSAGYLASLQAALDAAGT